MSQPDEITVNSAVQRCVTAWREALKRKGVKDPLEIAVWEHTYAGKAYRQALPWLSTPDNVDAYIACVAHGFAIGAIEDKHVTKLLYAAQVAITSRRARLQAEREARAQKAEKAKLADQAEKEKKQAAPPTPLPLGKNGGEAAAATPQVFTKKELHDARKQADIFLEQFYAGKLPPMPDAQATPPPLP